MKKLLEIYSKGLYRSIDEGLCDEVLSLFESLDSKEHKEEMQNLFKNKTISKTEKLNFALDLFGENKALQAFAKTLFNNNRFELIPDIFRHFVEFAQKKQNNIPVKVSVSSSPSDEIKERVSEFVKENIGPSTPINYEVKKNILGGIILKYKDNEIDLSINNKYNELKIMLAT